MTDTPSPDIDAVALEAARNLLPYLRWTIGPESPGYHPTMPSAVAAFEAAFGFAGKTSAQVSIEARALPKAAKAEGVVGYVNRDQVDRLMSGEQLSETATIFRTPPFPELAHRFVALAALSQPGAPKP